MWQLSVANYTVRLVLTGRDKWWAGHDRRGGDDIYCGMCIEGGAPRPRQALSSCSSTGPPPSYVGSVWVGSSVTRSSLCHRDQGLTGQSAPCISRHLVIFSISRTAS